MQYPAITVTLKINKLAQSQTFNKAYFTWSKVRSTEKIKIHNNFRFNDITVICFVWFPTSFKIVFYSYTINVTTPISHLFTNNLIHAQYSQQNLIKGIRGQYIIKIRIGIINYTHNIYAMLAIPYKMPVTLLKRYLYWLQSSINLSAETTHAHQV